MAGLRLVAELGGDGSGFERMMTRAGMTARTFGTQAIAPLKNLIAGAFTVGAIESLSRKTVQWASELRDVSDALGVNVEWLQKMQNGAKLVGADVEDIAKMIAELNKSRQDALQNPEGKNAGAFQRLGVSPAEIQNLSTQAFFDKIVKAFANGSNVQLQNDVQEVGGRAAKNLLGAFANQFQNNMPILSETLIDQLDDIGDEFTALGRTMMVSLAPAIIKVAEAIAALINTVKQLGSGLGKASANVDSKDVMRFMSNPIQGLIQFMSKGKHRKVEDDFVSGVMSEEQDQQAQKDLIDRAKQSARDARKRRENSPPMFDESAIAPKLKQSTPDSLVRVGNFLGQNPSSVNAIAQKQLEVSRKHLEQAKEMNQNMKQILNLLSGTGFVVPLR